MFSFPGPQLDNVSSSGFVYHECTHFIRRNEFHRICGKSGSDGQEKSEEERDFHLNAGTSVLFEQGNIGCHNIKKLRCYIAVFRLSVTQ